MIKISKYLIIFLLFLNILNANEIKLTTEEKEFLKNNAPLRLHNELNWPPFNFFENGKPKGFSIDYMNLLAKKLDVEVEYITGPSWDEFMQMLKKDELDAIINISKNKKRSQYIAFSSVFHTAANAIYVKDGNENIDSLEKLKGKTIIMPKGFFAQKAIEKYYPQIKQILVKDSLEALKLLSLGKADATIGKKNVLDYVITTNNISGVTPTSFVDDNRMVSLISIGTSKDKTILRDILKKAQKNVSDEEILELKRKWFGTNTKKTQRKEVSFLSKEELEYLKNRKVIRMCNISDLKPISFEEDGKIKGISIDILRKIEELLNIKFIPIPTVSWEQTKEFLKIKQCDVIPTVTNDEDIKDFTSITNAYLNYKLAIITQKNESVVSSLEEILDKPMAVKYDSFLIKELKSSNPKLKIIITKTHREALEKVSKGDAYFAIQPLPIASYYMSKYALKNLYISRYTNMTYSVSMAVHEKNDILLDILNKALEKISEDEHREIFNKWTAVSIKKGFDYKEIWQVIIITILIFAIFIYRQTILNKHNRKLQEANNQIEEKTIELAKQKLLFETLYNKSSDSVLILKDKVIADCNESTKNVLGFTKKELLNKALHNIAPEYQPDNTSSERLFDNKLEKVLIFGVSSFEAVLYNYNRKEVWVEIVLTSIEIENRRVIHTVIRDISNRKILEKRLEELNANLEEKIKREIRKNENSTKQLIQQSRLAQMGEMISMIAHQWRQPLAAISATTNNLLVKLMIEDKVNKEAFEEELILITEYSKHLSSTIDDFRNFFKTDKEKEEFDLEEVIKKSISITKTSIESKNIKLEINLEKNLKLFSYATEIQQVILNIIKNAEDILTEKDIPNKKICITTYKRNEHSVIIKIQDNGGGIEESLIEKIFDPYFSTKSDKDGTGLGLYMSRIIINDHCKGNLKVINENNGATFLIDLPI
ncbi:MAG: transporter substrate-binding domain-containing protein [Campylobacteraceae bacterium]|nr:transporter substrate-binding domain-containing protein [Campylobacteraceae bacterium]